MKLTDPGPEISRANNFYNIVLDLQVGTVTTCFLRHVRGLLSSTPIYIPSNPPIQNNLKIQRGKVL